MSDKLDSKWTWGGALLLGAGTLAAAGGIALLVHCARSRRQTRHLPGIKISEDDSSEPNNLHEGHHGPPFPFFPSGGVDETDFGGATYNELYSEIEKSIRALVGNNKRLYAAFTKYTEVSSQATERLKTLLELLMQWENALQANQPLPRVSSADINSVVKTLSPDPADQLAELQTLIPLVRAMLQFPPHIVKKARALSAVKRQILLDLIRGTPSGVDKHVYMDKYKRPYEDPDLYPIMTRMGFSIPSYQTKLTYTAAADDEKDQLYAGLYLLLGTAQPPQ